MILSLYVCMPESSVMNEGGSTNLKRSGLRDIYLNDHDQTVDFETLSDVESSIGWERPKIMYVNVCM